MIEPKYKPEISSEINGNAFFIMCVASKALRKAGADQEYIDKYRKEAMSGDYDNLLSVTMDYVDFN